MKVKVTEDINGTKYIHASDGSEKIYWICSKCGLEVHKDFRICPRCGHERYKLTY